MQGAPVFVKIEDYNNILEVMDILKKKIETVKKTLAELDSIRLEENAELERWNTELQMLDQRLKAINSALQVPENK